MLFLIQRNNSKLFKNIVYEYRRRTGSEGNMVNENQEENGQTNIENDA